MVIFSDGSVSIGVMAYAVSAAAFLLLAVLMATSWRGRFQGGLLLLACGVSTLWALFVASYLATGAPSFIFISVLELLRIGVWIWFVFRLLGPQLDAGKEHKKASLVAYGLVVLVALVFFVQLFEWLRFLERGGDGSFLFSYSLLGNLILAILGLVLVEQVFRNTHPQQRWAMKFLCIGLGAGFAYDFYLYSDAVLLGRLDADLWSARGFVQILIVPMIAISAARNPQWSLDVFVSRKVVFHSVAILAVGGYLLVMAAGGYFIRYWGGEWSGVAQVFFFFGAVVILFVLLFSGQVRASVKVFLNKNFFSYQYDYREEWLALTNKLSSERQGDRLRILVIQVLAGFVDSPSGLLWLRREDGCYGLSGCWNISGPKIIIKEEESLIKFLSYSKWIVDLDEYYESPEVYERLKVPEWLHGLQFAWLIVPLVQHDDLFGFVVLGRSHVARTINWEGRDLLKTAASQAAGYLALVEASEALVDARQFEAFNRLSAYIVHDLKNVVGQLSLVLDNSKKYRDNPEFVDDAFVTVENAVAKMERMLGQLRGRKSVHSSGMAIKLKDLVFEVVQRCGTMKPLPELEEADDLIIVADKDKLFSVIKHIVDNAQEATPDDGKVVVRLLGAQRGAVVEVVDTGCGMSEEFVRKRLFRPFDTTKGNAGMGIGVYECLDYMRSIGGDVEVNSKEGKGTLFRLIFPLK